MISKKKEPITLLIGDLVSFLTALWLTLFVRHLEIPTKEIFLEHFWPFSLLFLAWILIFYIAGLYDRHTTILRSKLPNVLGSAQLVNAGLAVVFFYFIPLFGIAPKTILFIYLFISSFAVLVWRMYGYFLVSRGQVENAVLIGSGEEMKSLLNEVNGNNIYNIKFVSSVDLARADNTGFWDEIVSNIYSSDVSTVVIDLANEKVEPVLPHLYNLIFSKVNFIDMHRVYEDIFNRIPLSLLRYNWFLENISTSSRGVYDILKRLMDMSVSLVLFIVSLVFYPIVFLAIKLEDGGPLFIFQERVGENNKIIKIIKFRSMSHDDAGVYGDDSKPNKVTKVGNFIRKVRIDELPQLWNVLRGDLSLIGPRPELPTLAKTYTEDIPYYNVRHLIKPGLSGWAQIYHQEHPHHGIDTEETKNKLSYDLYYIKNRSFLLDIKIALRTLNILLSIAGR